MFFVGKDKQNNWNLQGIFVFFFDVTARHIEVSDFVTRHKVTDVT